MPRVIVAGSRDFTDDVVEVVRCKDCRFHTIDPECFDEFEITDKPMMCVGIRYGGVDPDWFCEHGERMDSGKRKQNI